MARKLARKKGKDVPKFGGNEELGTVQVGDIQQDVVSVEVMSKTTLQDDEGYGDAVTIRCFVFGMNPITFNTLKPTAQELFNSHLKGIEISLWKDGWTIFNEVEPRVVFEEDKMRYLIYVAAKPNRGGTVFEKPLTLGDLVNG